MLNFRQFEAGPDPFGRKFQVMFKWLQTAISIRHSDTIDVKFVLVDENGGRIERGNAVRTCEMSRMVLYAMKLSAHAFGCDLKSLGQILAESPGLHRADRQPGGQRNPACSSISMILGPSLYFSTSICAKRLGGFSADWMTDVSPP